MPKVICPVVYSTNLLGHQKTWGILLVNRLEILLGELTTIRIASCTIRS